MTRPATWTQKALVAILGVAVLASAAAVAQRYGDYAFFDPLIDVKAQISRYYVEEPDEEALQLGAINGMLDVLGDPYTVYVPPRDSEDFNKDLTGEYVGIGAEVIVRNGSLTIVTPLDLDSPAVRAGLMADDRVVQIDGEPTSELNVQQSVDLLKGKPGTPVTLTVERDGEPTEITIVRDRIRTLSVKGFHRERDEEARWGYMIDPGRGIAYIRLTQFTPNCAEEVRRALLESGAAASAQDSTLGGLVLDLRWNSGGLLDEAIALADMLLQDGTIVSTRGRAHDEFAASAAMEGTLADFPMLVLINGQSASASEVLAGALVENGRAVVVGTRSFGKGSVQAVKSVESRGASGGGGVLKITEQRYYLPSGRSLQRLEDSATWGVDPSPGFLVPIDDHELSELFRVRREHEIIRHDASSAQENWADPDWILDQLKDRQLAAAVRAIQARLDTGDWVPANNRAMTDDAVTLAELERTMLARERLLRELSRVDRRMDALTSAVDPDDLEPDFDLWDDDDALIGGRVLVTNASGEPVATLRITGDDLERWLIDADLEPVADGVDN